MAAADMPTETAGAAVMAILMAMAKARKKEIFCYDYRERA